jgi:hypothetical protein
MASIGPKVGRAAWLSLLAVASGLAALGLNRDSDASLRDAQIEIALLAVGPTKQFIEFCKPIAEVNGGGREIGKDYSKEGADWARKQLKSTAGVDTLTTADFSFSGISWCPFPDGRTKLRDAIKFITEPSSMIYLSVHSELLNRIGAAYANLRRLGLNSPQTAESSTKFDFLVRSLADGAKINSIALVHDTEAFNHALFACANGPNNLIIFDTDLTKLPSHLYVIFGLSGGNHGGRICFGPKDLPPDIPIAGTGQFGMLFAHKVYFARMLQNNNRYSDQAALANQFFEFPATKAKLAKLGDTSIEDAASSLTLEVNEGSSSNEVFGLKLPLENYVALSCAGLILLFMVFYWSSLVNGKSALPEAIQDLNPALLTLVSVFGTVIWPTIGIYLASIRLKFVSPELAVVVQYISYAWIFGSVSSWLIGFRRMKA